MVRGFVGSGRFRKAFCRTEQEWSSHLEKAAGLVKLYTGMVRIGHISAEMGSIGLFLAGVAKIGLFFAGVAKIVFFLFCRSG